MAQRVHSLLDTVDQFNPRVCERISLGDVRITINAASHEEVPTSNRNRARVITRLDREQLEDIRGIFSARGISRFFIWLAPEADQISSHQTLAGQGFTRFDAFKYVTLARSPIAAPISICRITARRIEHVDATVTHAALTGIFGNSLAADCFARVIADGDHAGFVAFNAEEPISAGLLFVSERMGYLGWAGTRVDARRRGGQAALITARLAHAKEVGCDVCICETNSDNEASLRNLRRAGFEIVYETTIFASPEPT